MFVEPNVTNGAQIPPRSALKQKRLIVAPAETAWESNNDGALAATWNLIDRGKGIYSFGIGAFLDTGWKKCRTRRFLSSFGQIRTAKAAFRVKFCLNVWGRNTRACFCSHWSLFLRFQRSEVISLSLSWKENQNHANHSFQYASTGRLGIFPLLDRCLSGRSLAPWGSELHVDVFLLCNRKLGNAHLWERQHLWEHMHQRCECAHARKASSVLSDLHVSWTFCSFIREQKKSMFTR